MGCALGAMRRKARTGQCRLIPPSPAPTSMPPEHPTPRPRTTPPVTSPRGAESNHKNSGKNREGLGRSRGGLSTKIHLVADRRCRPITKLTTPGQYGDSPRFIPLMESIRIPRRGWGRPRKRPGRALADKAYSSKANCAYLREHKVRAVIPIKKDQKANRLKKGSAGGRPPNFDAERYKERNTVERCVNKLWQFRAVATRFDKREVIYQGTIDVASIKI
jgi:transposase